MGAYMEAVGAELGWPDPYDYWISLGGQPDVTDFGHGAHPQDYIAAPSSEPVAAGSASIWDRLEARPLGIPNYGLVAGAGLGVGALLAHRRGSAKRNPRKRRRGWV